MFGRAWCTRTTPNSPLWICSRASAQDAAHGRLARLKLRLREGSADHQALYEGPLRMPAVHPERYGAAYRFMYWIADSTRHDAGPSVVRFDVGARALSSVPTSFARHLGALTVVPISGRPYAEEAAFVLTVVYDAASDASDLLVVSRDEAGALRSGYVRLSSPLRRPTRGLWLPGHSAGRLG